MPNFRYTFKLHHRINIYLLIVQSYIPLQKGAYIYKQKCALGTWILGAGMGYTFYLILIINQYEVILHILTISAIDLVARDLIKDE